jgi:hypothetical protein
MLSLLTVADHEGRTCKIVTQYLIAGLASRGLPAKVLLNSDNTASASGQLVCVTFSRDGSSNPMQRDTCDNTTGP